MLKHSEIHASPEERVLIRKNSPTTVVVGLFNLDKKYPMIISNLEMVGNQCEQAAVK